jgi:hypothetical protein
MQRWPASQQLKPCHNAINIRRDVLAQSPYRFRLPLHLLLDQRVFDVVARYAPR